MEKSWRGTRLGGGAGRRRTAIGERVGGVGLKEEQTVRGRGEF